MFSELFRSEYNNSSSLIDHLRSKITSQEIRNQSNSKLEIIKDKLSQLRNSQCSEKLSTIRKEMNKIQEKNSVKLIKDQAHLYGFLLSYWLMKGMD